MARELKKPEVSKNPRYIDTRLDEVYPVRKSNMFRMLSGKAKVGNFLSEFIVILLLVRCWRVETFYFLNFSNLSWKFMVIFVISRMIFHVSRITIQKIPQFSRIWLPKFYLNFHGIPFLYRQYILVIIGKFSLMY